MVHEFPPRGTFEAVLATVLRWTLRLLLKPVFSRRISVGFQRRWLAGSVWSLCRSWYRMEGGRIVALFPGFTAEYVKAVKHPAMDDYQLRG